MTLFINNYVFILTGSSLGSFDSEFRNTAYSVYLPQYPHYDPTRSGSLDSRTQDLQSYSTKSTDITLPNHSRSSSDIVCSTATRYVITSCMDV